jgi:hypothetical protein
MKLHLSNKKNPGKLYSSAICFLKKKFFDSRMMLLFILFFFFSLQDYALGVWMPVNAVAPDLNGGVMLLLSDGTVMVKTEAGDVDSIGNIWNKLTPDIHGSYANGTWTTLAPMNDNRLYFSSEVLKDGRVYVAGGEYGTGINKSEVYNPLTNTWTMCPATGFDYVDANSEILPDGKVLQACEWDDVTFVYDPLTNTYDAGTGTLGTVDESAWVKLPDNSILFVDMGTTSSERYIPSLGQWVTDGLVPTALYDNYGDETGAAFLLPDGRAFFLGATGHTAYYAPSGNISPGTWMAGPNIPGNYGTPDAAAAMMVNGNILCAVSPKPSSPTHIFDSPTKFYEFNYLTNSFTQVNAPYGGLSINEPCYYTNMLDLPDGTVLYSDQGSAQYYIYTPSGSPLASGKPTIQNVHQADCSTFTITGTLFNGISEGAAYGDDWQMATNYPLVRLTSGSNVYYARTFNWNSTGVQAGNLPDTAQFTLPAGLTAGTYSLVVSVNGISSDSVVFIHHPLLTSNTNPPPICSNTLFTYVPTSSDSNATFTWTREVVGGISNPAITTPQTVNPTETLVNTSATPKSVVYSFVITPDTCNTIYYVTVVVNPSPTAVINGNQIICQGDSDHLVASGGSNYLWSTNDSTASIFVSPDSVTTYSVTVTNSFGCTKSTSLMVSLNPLPVLIFNGLPDTACANGGSSILTAIPSGGVFSGVGIAGNIFNPSGVLPGNDTIRYFYTDSQGCSNSISHSIYVTICDGIAETESSVYSMFIFPNPAADKATIVFKMKTGGDYSVQLVDVLGRTVGEEGGIALPGENSHVLNFRENAKGIYIVLLRSGKSIMKAKLALE